MIFRMKNALTAAAVLVTALMSQQALAHAHLASASPASKAEVSDSPKELTLAFTEGVEAGFSGVSVTGADGKTVTTGKATVDAADSKVLHIPLSSELKAGDYRVDWHVLSVDGHKTKGMYHFSVK